MAASFFAAVSPPSVASRQMPAIVFATGASAVGTGQPARRATTFDPWAARQGRGGRGRAGPAVPAARADRDPGDFPRAPRAGSSRCPALKRAQCRRNARVFKAFGQAIPWSRREQMLARGALYSSKPRF